MASCMLSVPWPHTVLQFLLLQAPSWTFDRCKRAYLPCLEAGIRGCNITLYSRDVLNRSPRFLLRLEHASCRVRMYLFLTHSLVPAPVLHHLMLETFTHQS